MNRYLDRHLTTRPTTYSRHNCSSQHRTWKALKSCLWPRAAWVAGLGSWAVVAYCRVTTVTLWETEDEAREAMGIIDATACGGRCNGRHQLIHLSPELTARMPQLVQPEEKTA